MNIPNGSTEVVGHGMGGSRQGRRREEEKEGNTAVEMKCMPVLGRVIADPPNHVSKACVWVNLSLKIREALFHLLQCMPLMSEECIHNVYRMYTVLT